MATQACLNNIKKEDPPKYCGDEHCGHIQSDINKYCEHSGLGGDVPVPQWTSSGKCWCCCSCMAWGTPIEVTPGNYRMIEAIFTGDKVLATGGNLDGWEEREVTGVGGIAPGVPLDFCYAAEFELADGTMRHLVSTADHLYLVPGGVLVPVQDLRPGDLVMQADGQHATVRLVAPGQFQGGVRNFAMGDFDPKAHPDDPYKGHLMNTFGIVTADLAVQMAFYSNQFAGELVGKSDEDIAPIGSRRFFAEHDTQDYQRFIHDPMRWPMGFKAKAPALLNIPPSALAYFTDAQAADLDNADPDQNHGNSKALANFKYLKNILRGFYPGFYYIADWSDDTPNAWYFNENDQTYIVMSGGLLRLSTLNVPGLSMVASHLIAQAEGYGCTGDADYWGAALYLREFWYNDLYFDMFEKGLGEVRATFDLISKDHWKENPNNICRQPSLECRLQAIANGGGFAGVPDCAKQPPDFVVTSAEAKSLEEVVVSFSAKLFPGTATDPEHYAINRGVTVLQVVLNADNVSVTLIVQGMRAAITYTVTVSDVLSDRGQCLAPDHDTAEFTTP